VHVDVGALYRVLLAEVDDDLEGVVADVENVRVSPFGLPLIHASLAVGATGTPTTCRRLLQEGCLIAHARGARR
jgi:hypothetical protein